MFQFDRGSETVTVNVFNCCVSVNFILLFHHSRRVRVTSFEQSFIFRRYMIKVWFETLNRTDRIPYHTVLLYSSRTSRLEVSKKASNNNNLHSVSSSSVSCSLSVSPHSVIFIKNKNSMKGLYYSEDRISAAAKLGQGFWSPFIYLLLF